MESMILSKPRLDTLTSLRFFAAFYVMAFHATRPWPSIVGGGVPREIHNIAMCGYVSVGFFFMLSGFILAYTYGSADKIRLERRTFWWARFARIYPVYVLGLVIGMAPAWMELQKIHGSVQGAQHFIQYAIADLLMLGSWMPGAFILNYPAWSLAVESFFYLVFPSVAVVCWRLSGRKLLALCLVAAALSLLLPLIAVLMDPELWAWKATIGAPTTLSPPSAEWAELIKTGAVARLPDFLMGIGIGKLFLENMAKRERASDSKFGPGPRAWIGALLVLAVLSQADRIPYLLLHNGLLNLLFAYIIYQVAMDTGRASRWLRWPLLILLGEASYALYILHVPIRDLCVAAFRLVGLDSALSPVTRFALYAALVTTISTAVFKLLEAPLRIWLRSVYPAKGLVP